MRSKAGYIYIVTNRRNGTLYTGVTSNLTRRIFEHKSKEIEGFSREHRLTDLVYFEGPMQIGAAIEREKKLKKWRRKWKLALIEKSNPTWRDRYREICNSIESDYNML